MKQYIDFNTKLKTAATNDFEKDFFKLMNNSVFGKTMENIRKHRNIKLVTNKDNYLRTVMKPNFKSGVLFGGDLMGCEMGRTKVVMNKPVYLGQAILDISKIVTYEFHYDYMKLKFQGPQSPCCKRPKDLQLCYMDTDSLVYHIKQRISTHTSRTTWKKDSIPLVTFQMGIMYRDRCAGPSSLTHWKKKQESNRVDER